MVDFRYHIVSIVAIFLALAIGIVLGAGPLKTTSDAGLKTQVSDLRQARNTVQSNLAAAQNQVTFLDKFGDQVAPALLAGRLAGLDVAVVSAPGAPASVAAGLVTALGQAGAYVSIKAQIGNNWTDPDQQTALAAALRAGRPTPSTSASVPASSTSASPSPSPSAGSASTAGATGTPTASAAPTPDLNLYQEAGMDLAHAILGSARSPSPTAPRPRPSVSAPASRPASPGPSRSARPPSPLGRPLARPSVTPVTRALIQARILSALEAGGFVTLSGSVPRVRPTLVVLVAADPPATADDGSRAATQTLLLLAQALRTGSDGTVVAGDSGAAAGGGLLSAIRGARPAADGLSTVDSADTPVGRIAVPLALLEQQRAGRFGQYGQGTGADEPLPQVSGIGPG